MTINNLIIFFNKYKLIPNEYYEQHITDKKLLDVIKKTDEEKRVFLDEMYKVRIAHQNNIIAKEQCKKLDDILDRFIKKKEENDIKRSSSIDIMKGGSYSIKRSSSNDITRNDIIRRGSYSIKSKSSDDNLLKVCNKYYTDRKEK